MDSRVERAGSANILGKYRLIAELGHGGMAEVFLAVAQGPAGFNKLTVIKQIRPQLAEDPEFLAMFLDEARLAARLNHPHIVQTNEVGHEGHRYFLAMEYLEGQPLNRIIHRVGRERFPLAMHLAILTETLAGLHYAHELTDYDGTPLEVVHRDVTPHNVFVTYEGQVKVVDFGIAKAMSSTAETKTGVLKGKVAYMAPEQARGEKVDRRADVVSVGVMLWEAAVGRRLWKGMPDVAILARVVGGEIPPPREVRADVAPELEAIILRALAPRREDRYGTAGELAADLERLLDRWGRPASLRDAGRLIAQRFEEERAKIRALIDAQLRDARAMPTDEYRAVALPVIDPRSIVTSSKDASNPTDPRASMQSTSSYPGSASLTARSAAPDPPPARRALLLPIAAAGGAALAAAVWLVIRTSAPPPPAPPPPPAAEPTAAPAPADVELSVAARPAEAKIIIDGALAVGNPIAKRVPRDGAAHTIRVEAPGYVT
ncbi:MAG: serine/threonine protein kinase, partial [Polyangiaceae bacterium]|nr:serine/threonine protein kinase [Polyangiaceae bacterium]